MIDSPKNGREIVGLVVKSYLRPAEKNTCINTEGILSLCFVWVDTDIRYRNGSRMNEKEFDEEFNLMEHIIVSILTDTRTIFVDINPN